MAKRKSPEAAKRELASFARRTRRGVLVEKVKVQRSELAGTRESCKAKKSTIRKRQAQLRERKRELVEACRAASIEGREKVRAAREALAAFRAEQRSGYWTPPKEKLRRTATEARQESDEAVARNIDEALLPVWRKVKRTIRADAHQSRTEAFEQWAHDNPAEVERIQWEAAERDAERLIAQYVAAGYEVEEVA